MTETAWTIGILSGILAWNNNQAPTEKEIRFTSDYGKPRLKYMLFTKGKRVKEKMKFVVKVVQRNQRSGSVWNTNMIAVRCGAVQNFYTSDREQASKLFAFVFRGKGQTIWSHFPCKNNERQKCSALISIIILKITHNSPKTIYGEKFLYIDSMFDASFYELRARYKVDK